jgi:hypothetical protein
LGQYSLLIDDWAGLAHIALAQGRPGQALEHVQDILSWIDVNGLEGIEYPLQVYLICYRVLQATAQGDPAAIERAQKVLTVAHTALMERANSIGDEALRLKFLENVKTNREIIAAWQARVSST